MLRWLPLLLLLLAPACECNRAPLTGPPPSTPLLTEPRWPGVPMDADYAGEEVAGGHFPTAVQYLDAAAREPYRLQVRDGLLVDAAGTALDPDMPNHPDRDNLAIFVMDLAGNIYLTFDRVEGVFHHSSFVAGAPVAAAGDFTIEQGRISRISNYSGHYKPPAETLERVKTRLTELGVDFSDAKIARFGED
jgi:hypothetical protein